MVFVQLLLILLWTVGSNIIEGVLLYIVVTSDTTDIIKDKIAEKFMNYLVFDEIIIYIENLVPFFIGVQLLFIYYTFGLP